MLQLFFLNIHLQCHLASLKISSPKLNFNFSKTSPFTLLYLLLFMLCAGVKELTTQSRKREKLQAGCINGHSQVD